MQLLVYTVVILQMNLKTVRINGDKTTVANQIHHDWCGGHLDIPDFGYNLLGCSGCILGFLGFLGCNFDCSFDFLDNLDCSLECNFGYIGFLDFDCNLDFGTLGCNLDFLGYILGFLVDNWLLVSHNFGLDSASR